MPDVGTKEEQEQRLVYNLLMTVSNATLNGRRRVEISVDDALRIAIMLLKEEVPYYME